MAEGNGSAERGLIRLMWAGMLFASGNEGEYPVVPSGLAAYCLGTGQMPCRWQCIRFSARRRKPGGKRRAAGSEPFNPGGAAWLAQNAPVLVKGARTELARVKSGISGLRAENDWLL